MKMKHVLLAGYVLLSLTFSASAQDVENDSDTASDVPSPSRERLVVSIDHAHVDLIEEALLRIFGSDDFKIMGEPTSNKLIVDAPTDVVPHALGLIRELDRPRAYVDITVTELEIPLDVDDEIQSGESDVVWSKIVAARDVGELQIVSKTQFAVIENESTEIAVGAQVPMETGRFTMGPGRGNQQRNYQFQDVGSTFKCSPRISDNNVVLQFEFERSGLALVAEVDNEDEHVPASTINTSVQSKTRIAKGKSEIITGTRLGADKKPVRWKLVISADVREND